MATSFDPATFWSEVRRYGATIVPYTWTMLRELVDAPPHPEERHHPIRLFVGSGMPPNLWRRVLDRFAPANVLELYASTRTGAIVGNVSGRKVGALGRPLPGTPKVEIAAYDPATGRLQIGRDGFASRCEAGEPGMLLVEADHASAGHDVALRGVFRPDDAWIATGDLFRRDDDGDLWLVDEAAALIVTAHGTVSPRAVQDALGQIDAVDLAVCYGADRARDGGTAALAAVSLRPGRALDAAAIGRALESLAPEARPDAVHVLEAIPVTSWFRPSTAELRLAGHRPDAGRGAWRRDPRTGRYRTIKTTRRDT
jgi:putative long chain acyl-CoA synthase